MDELRDRIARAIAGADSRTLCGVRPCTACQTGDIDQPCDDCRTMADAAIAALGLTEEEVESRRMCDAVPTILRRYVTPWGTCQPKETP